MFRSQIPSKAGGAINRQAEWMGSSLTKTLLLTALMYAGAITAAQAAETLYVADVGNVIAKYVPPSSTATTFASGGILSNPTGLTFDSAGDLFVSGHSTSNILKFASTGGVLSTTSTIFARSTDGVVAPWGLTFDSAGSLFLANTGGIEKFASKGGVLSNSGTVFSSRVSHGMFALEFDSTGNLFATDANGSTLTKFEFTGGVLSSTGITFANMDGRGLAFDKDGSLFMARTNNTIVKFASTGGVLSSTSTVFANTGLSNPYGLAFDNTGNLFVSNNGNGSIAEFTSTGGVLSSTPTTFSSNRLTAGFLAFGPSAVPEPSTAILMAIGGVSFALRRRMHARIFNREFVACRAAA